MAVAAIGATTVTVIATCLLAATLAATRKAAIYTRGMLREAKAATKAARDTLKVTQDIGQAQVRAYVELAELDFGHSDNGPGHVWIKPTVKNSGNSPALDVDLVLKLTLFVYNTTVDLFVAYDCGALSVGETAFPAAHMLTNPLDAATFYSAEACRVEAVLFAKDVFGETRTSHNAFDVGGAAQQFYHFGSATKTFTPNRIVEAQRAEFEAHRMPSKRA